jgi:hypothetical protein
LTIHSSQSNAFNNDPYFLNGDTTLYSNYAKASWNVKVLSKSKIYEEATYIIDDNTHSTSVNNLQGWNVDVEQNINGYTFVQCNVYGSGLITTSRFTTCQLNMIGTVGNSCNFTNCKLNEYIFNGSPTIGAIVNCIFDIDDFIHKVNLWNTIYVSQYTEPNIDFKNVNIPSDFGVYGQYNSDRTYSNFIGTSTTGHEFGDGMGDHTYTFKNVSGNIILDGNGNNTYIFENSNVKLKFNINGHNYTIVARDSNVIIDEDLANATIMADSSTITLKNYYNTVSIKNSTLFGDVANRRLICSNFSAYSSIVNEEVSAPNILYKDSQINKDIYSTNNGTSIVTYIDNCIWNDIQQHISSDTANTIISGAWTNNNATKANPIVFDMTNLASTDGQHQYEYDNNNGTFLPRFPKMTWIDNSWATPGAAWGYEQSLSNANPFKVILCSTGGPWDTIGTPIGMGVHGLNMDMPFFSIGSCTAVFKLSVSYEGSMKYGDRSMTQSYAFVGGCVDSVNNPASYKCTSFNDKLIGQPVPSAGWVNNSDWPTSCVATFERVK